MTENKPRTPSHVSKNVFNVTPVSHSSIKEARQMSRLFLGTCGFCRRLSLNNNNVMINISLYNENTGTRL